MNILENYLNIKKRIETLNNKTNLIVVSKGQILDKIKIILNTGHIHFGENRVQEALLKWSDYLSNNANIQLHLIGGLQSNKAKQAFQIFNYIHSLDSEKLAKTFSNLESNGQKKIKYFIQVGIPTLSAAVCAMLLVLFIALLAQANSLAKIPRPVKMINQPGPGATSATTPTKVTNPPINPTITRLTIGVINLSYS